MLRVEKGHGAHMASGEGHVLNGGSAQGRGDSVPRGLCLGRREKASAAGLGE